MSALDAVMLLREGNFAAALPPLRAALSDGDASPATMLNLAIAEDHAGDRTRARRLMQSVAVRLPDWDEPLLRLAESLRAANDNAGAEEAYRQVLELNPVRQEALTALGGLLLMRDEAEEARDLLLRCCEAAPDNAEAWNTLGLALRKTDAPAQALAAFHHAQALRPDNAEYVLNGVNAAPAAEAADAELDRLCAACLRHPLNAVLQLGRGMLLDQLGRRAEAIDALEAAVQLAPGELVPLSLLAGVLARSTKVAEAEAALRQVCLLDPDNPKVRNDHAAILMRVHRHGEARAILNETVERWGPQPFVLCNLANATTCVGLQGEGGGAGAAGDRACAGCPAAAASVVQQPTVSGWRHRGRATGRHASVLCRGAACGAAGVSHHPRSGSAACRRPAVGQFAVSSGRVADTGRVRAPGPGAVPSPVPGAEQRAA